MNHKMPTLDRFGPYRVFFYMADREEPPHVHVERDDCMAKIWLQDLGVAINCGFPAHEIGTILEKVESKRDEYTRAWKDTFG